MTLVDASTGEVVQPLDESDARHITDAIKSELSITWDLITEAYQRRAWDALGYASWDAYCRSEFGASRIKLPSEKRREVVSSLRDAGLSIRAISAATGTSVGTVHSDLSPAAGVQNRTPAAPLNRTEVEPNFGSKVKGSDGKTYTATRSTTERTTETVEPAEPVGREAVDLAAERTARSDAAYRESLSKARVKVNDLTSLDPERCARVLPLEDRDLEMSFIERTRSWLTDYERLLTTTSLRSVQ